MRATRPRHASPANEFPSRILPRRTAARVFAGSAFVIHIRDYHSNDESASLAILDSNRPKYFTASERELFTTFLKQMNQPFFVVEMAGHVRGYGGFHVRDDGVAVLDWGMVHANPHRQSVGANLLRWRVQRIRQIAYAWCVLVDTSQHTAPFLHASLSRPFVPLKMAMSRGCIKCTCGLLGTHQTRSLAP